MAQEPKSNWLSENETALLCAVKCLCRLLTAKGVATPDEVDAILLQERDRFAARAMPKGAAILQLVVEQRQRDDQSQPEIPKTHMGLAKGTA